MSPLLNSRQINWSYGRITSNNTLDMTQLSNGWIWLVYGLIYQTNTYLTLRQKHKNWKPRENQASYQKWQSNILLNSSGLILTSKTICHQIWAPSFIPPRFMASPKQNNQWGTNNKPHWIIKSRTRYTVDHYSVMTRLRLVHTQKRINIKINLNFSNPMRISTHMH